MPLRNTQTSYGSVAKLLHWAVVLLIIAQFILGIIADDLPNGIRKLEILAWHKSGGMLILLLALGRIGWRLVNPPPPQLTSYPHWQQVIAKTTHVVLYILILVQPVTGWMMSSAKNYPVSFYNLFQWPDLVQPNEALSEYLEGVHKALAITLLVVASVHIAAALYHHFWLKDDVLRRMLPFGSPSGARGR
jgi:cytochrome b561